MNTWLGKGRFSSYGFLFFIFKKYLFGCTGSQFRHVTLRIFLLWLWQVGSFSWGMMRALSCSMWGLILWLGLEPQPPVLGALSLGHRATREVLLAMVFRLLGLGTMLMPHPFKTVTYKVKVKVMSNSLWPHGLYSPWNSPDQNTGVSSLSLLQGIFPTQGSNPGLLHCRWILDQLSHQGSPRILEGVAYPFSRGSSRPRNRTRASSIGGGFFTSWATRETR